MISACGTLPFVGLLGEIGAEQLSEAQHQTLLCHLAHECLDKDPLRGLLSARLEVAEGLKKGMREAVAEDKGKLKARARPASCAAY